MIRHVAPGQAELPVEARWCSGDTLFGGALMAGLISAATALAEQPLLSMSATFAARARRPGTVGIAMERLGSSRSLVPVHLTATQDDAVVATASTVHVAEIPSGRPGRAEAPSVRPPDDCPPRSYQRPAPGSISDELDVRVAGLADPHSGAPPSCRVWARWPAAGSGPIDASVLALLSDHIPFAPRLLLGDEWSGTTLDATLRILPGIDTVAADAWVLLDVAFDLLGDLAHGTVWLWSSPGPTGAATVQATVPLAIGTQTLRLRTT